MEKKTKTNSKTLKCFVLTLKNNVDWTCVEIQHSLILSEVRGLQLPWLILKTGLWRWRNVYICLWVFMNSVKTRRSRTRRLDWFGFSSLPRTPAIAGVTFMILNSILNVSFLPPRYVTTNDKRFIMTPVRNARRKYFWTIWTFQISNNT